MRPIVSLLCVLLCSVGAGGAIRLASKPIAIDAIYAEKISRDHLSIRPEVQASLTLSDPHASLNQIVARPLFHSDRRKFVPLPPAPRVPDDRPSQVSVTPRPERQKTLPPPKFAIHGVSITPTGSQVLLGLDNESPDWKGLGDLLENWSIAQIDSRGVVVESGGNEIRLDLYPTEELTD